MKNLQRTAGEIKRLHQCIASHDQKNLAEAVKIGHLLLKVRAEKKMLKERNFKKWVEPACGFSYFQATKYIRLAEFRRSISSIPEKIKQFDFLGLMEAYVQAGVMKTANENEKGSQSSPKVPDTATDVSSQQPLEK